MRKFFKLLGFLSATLLLFFVVAILAFYYLTRVGELRRYLVDEIERQTELKAEASDASIEIGWTTGIVFQNVAISEPGATAPAVSAQRVTARVALRPLLHRQVIFYEIRLAQPMVRLSRDSAGHFPLLDRLLSLPFLKQQNNEFSFDLRALRIDGGDVEVTERSASDEEQRWRLAGLKLDLERVRGQRLREFFQTLLQHEPAENPGAALEFDLKTAVINASATTNLNAQGYLVFPQDNFDLREARWNADVDLVNFPAALIKDYAGPRLGLKSISGQLAQRLHVQGNPSERLRINGDLEFRQLAVEAPELFLAPLRAANGRVSFDADLTPRAVQIRRGDFRANDLKFSLQGEIGALDGDPRARLNLTSLSAPVAVLRQYLPIKIIESARLEEFVNSIQAGQLEVKKAGVDATLSQLRHLAQTGPGQRVWFEAEVRDFAAAPLVEGALPLRSLNGSVALANGVLAVRNTRAGYGDSQLSDVNGAWDGFSSQPGKWNLRGRGEVNLAEMKEQIKFIGPGPQADKFLASLRDLGGRSKIEFAVERAPQAPPHFSGSLILERARLRYRDYALTDVQGVLSVSDKEIRAEKIRAQLNGSPIEIQLALNDYAGDAGSFDLGIESSGMRAGVLTHLLLDTGDLRDPGVVRGALRYAGSLAEKGPRRLTGNLDLLNVQLMVHPLLQPLRELSGRIKIDDSGIDFQNLRALLVGVPAAVSGRWRFSGKPQLLFDFAAPNLDITYLISQIDPELSDFYANLVAEGKITINKGRIKNFEFGDLKTNATIDHRVWRLTGLTATSVGGSIQGVTTIFDKPDTLGVAAEPKVQGVPIQSFLHWFGISTAEMNGQVTLTGKLETVGRNDAERKQNLNGAFNLRIADGTINRMRIVVQILNLLDLSRWFSLQVPDLTKQGIRFRSITGDFKVTKGVYTTENLIVDSNDLRMTGAGKIDVPKDEVDFIVAVRPFAGIDTAMSYIPLLGRSIAAIKNSFLVASFNISGKIDDPTITPAPLGTLSEWFWGVLGIPKNIIGFGEGEPKKEPPPEPAGAPSK
jgi:uncharacterized protein YhdP